MKSNAIKSMATLIFFAFIMSSCSREYYKTRTGKAKLKYYNDIQFGANAHPKKKF